ncbi:MAG: diguanylate cyclase [bacterium]
MSWTVYMTGFILSTVIEKLHTGTKRQKISRLRLLVEQSFLSIGPDVIRVTISIGAASVLPGDTVDALVKRADKLMYRSKAAGKNRVSI